MELRASMFDQYQQQLHNLSSSTMGLDQSFGERIREQVRLAEQLDHEEELRRQSLTQSISDEEVKRLVNKLHTEGNCQSETNSSSDSHRMRTRLNMT